MTFTPPKEPLNWQNAYTRDQAFRDSDKQSSEFLLPIGIALVTVLVYGLLSLARFHFFYKYSLYTIGFIALAILIFLIVSSLLILKGSSRFASTFFEDFYRPPENIDPVKIINYRLNGVTRLPEPLNMMSQFKYIIARDGEIDKKDEWPTWMALNLGGPLMLIVFDGCALYLERGNKFSRVVGPGPIPPFLEWHETIKYAVDLRPKVKEGEFSVWTKDGINIRLAVRMECRIGDPNKKDPQGNLVYPYDPEAVKKAVERYALKWPKPEEEPSENSWVDTAWGQITGIIPRYIGSRMLDDILIADRKSGQILSPQALEKLLASINEATNAFGVYVINLQVTSVIIPKEVQEQHKTFWEVERQSINTIIQGEAKAFSIRTREKARADSQRDLILAIAEGLEKNKASPFTEPLLLSLYGVLDESLHDPLIRAQLANETLDTLERLRELLDK